MLQVLRDILKRSHDETEVLMLFGNQTEEDILLRDELDACNRDPRFEVHYTIDRAPEGREWKYSVGFVTPEMIQTRLHPPGSDTYTLLCGPPPMVKAVKN